MSQDKSPTKEFYELLESAYDVFNERLFDGKLSNCLLTVQREKKTMGFFSKNRWVNNAGDTTHEIALNPSYFANHKVIEIFQTLVHEQCHLWQYEFGKPSRAGYHNVEWADKMVSIGLQPSHTGYPGGKRTGQKMSDYPIEGGHFLKVCTGLIKQGITIPWFDRFTALPEPSQVRISNIDLTIDSPSSETSVELALLYTPVSELVSTTGSQDASNDKDPLFQVAARTPSKIKYTCPCNINVWGKPNLRLICGECNQQFEASE